MRINYDIEDVKAFCALARVGQYTATAQQLCITSSALSRRIAKLEERVGAKLFDRTTRKVVLTPLGLGLYEQVQPLLQSLDAVFTEAARRASGQGGRLAISTVASVAYSVLPGVLQQFAVDHPNVYLSIRDGNATEATRLVEEREVEFGITTPVSFSAALSTEKIASYGFNLVYSAGSLSLRRRRSIEWSEIVGMPVVGLNPLSSTRLQIDSELSANGINLPWRLEVDQVATLLGLVMQGEFVAVMPALFRPTLPSLKTLPLIGPSISRDLYLVMRNDVSLSRQGRHLTALIRSACSSGKGMPLQLRS